jgi:hypothetical protein
VAANVEELLELAERARPDVAGDIVGVVAHR